MDDYGFRISQDGYDVKSCDDVNCVVTSKYANLKGTLYGEASVSNNGNEIKTITIEHNLNYIPFVKGIFSWDNSQWSQLPRYNSGIDFPYIIHSGVYINCDDTNVYITSDEYNPLSPTPKTVYVKFQIFIDKGKL